TATALGGALFTVRSDALCARMVAVERTWPTQPRRAFAHKLAKTIAFLVAQHPLVYGAIAALLAWRGSSIGDVLRRATRGFPADSVDELLALLRQRPSAPLLTLLARRLAKFSVRRLEARAAAGEALLLRLRGRGVL